MRRTYRKSSYSSVTSRDLLKNTLHDNQHLHWCYTPGVAMCKQWGVPEMEICVKSKGRDRGEAVPFYSGELGLSPRKKLKLPFVQMLFGAYFC